MTQYLVFENPVGAIGAFLQKQVIVKWNDVKYIEPVDAINFKLQLNNGGSISIDASGGGLGKAYEVIKKIRSLVTSSARISSGKVLTVKPDFIGQWTVTAFIYTPPSGGGGVTGIPYLIDTNSVYVADVPEFLSGNPQGNTFLGIDVGQYHTTGVSNTAFGYKAMVGGFDGEGSECVFIGYEAGADNNTEDRNVGIGYQACNSPTGNDNVAVGHNAQAGSFGNVTVGSQAGASLVGSENVLMGSSAGDDLTSGDRNIAIGPDTLGSSTSSDENIAIGYDAIGQGTAIGSWNVGIGKSALLKVSTGERNIGIGGYFAGDSLTTGSNNTALGFWSLSGEQTGSGNVAIGESALKNQNASTSTSTANIGIGYNAGSSLSTGTNNIVIGTNAQASSATATDEITLGNSSITVIRAAVTSITSLSDERDKKDIEDLDTGLDFIKSLKPRKFVWDNRDETITEQQIDKDGNISDVEKEIINSNKGKKDFGFIAQEVKSLDNDTLRLIYDENPDKLEMSYGKLVPILVKAIQELINELDKKQDK